VQGWAATPAAGPHPPVPKVCVVTGGTGFVGQRLVEMLVERGAERVVSFDIVPKPPGAWEHPAIEYVVGDICDVEQIAAVVRGAGCVWHNAAAVGPFHPKELYRKVNYQGTLNVIEACRRHKVPKIVMSSSPSTRFTGSDIEGLTEAEMPKLPLGSYMQEYAGSKAEGEMALRAACCAELMTCAVAPHQVYGPRDNLFLPNMLEAAGGGKLRVFAAPRTGGGFNKVCFTHVDNYAHGLIIAERALRPGSPALGKFYIVTDGDTHTFTKGGGHVFFWGIIAQAAAHMGFTPPLFSKAKLPAGLLFAIAYVGELYTLLTGKNLKLNPFNVLVLTMHRYFTITAAERDLGFKPIVPFEEGWADTLVWFKSHWLPGYLKRRETESGLAGIADQSQRKIDIQAKKKAM
jgi:nucleoside-diphosphate-sugar epimerase